MFVIASSSFNFLHKDASEYSNSKLDQPKLIYFFIWHLKLWRKWSVSSLKSVERVCGKWIHTVCFKNLSNTCSLLVSSAIPWCWHLFWNSIISFRNKLNLLIKINEYFISSIKLGRNSRRLRYQEREQERTWGIPILLSSWMNYYISIIPNNFHLFFCC